MCQLIVTNARYEAQRDQMMGQSFNMEQAYFATQTMQDTIQTVFNLSFFYLQTCIFSQLLLTFNITTRL